MTVLISPDVNQEDTPDDQLLTTKHSRKVVIDFINQMFLDS